MRTQEIMSKVTATVRGFKAVIHSGTAELPSSLKRWKLWGVSDFRLKRHPLRSTKGETTSEVTWQEGPFSLLLATPLWDGSQERPILHWIFGQVPMYTLRIPKTGKLTQGNSCPEWCVYSVDMNYPKLCGAGSCLAWWPTAHSHRRLCAHTVYSRLLSKPGEPRHRLWSLASPVWFWHLHLSVDLGHVTSSL